MNHSLTLFLLSATLSVSASVSDLRVENLSSPLALDTETPRFSWRIDAPGATQATYRIMVASTPEALASGTPDLWDSGTVGSATQQWVEYKGRRLPAMKRLWWTVEAVTADGERHTPGAPSEFGTGMLSESQWGGRWIGLETPRPGDLRGTLRPVLPARYLRKVFTLPAKEVKSATAYISGLGNYRLFVGGTESAPCEVLKPVPSQFDRTVYYNALDVTPQVTALTDSLLPVGIVLGPGRYFPPRQNKPYKIPVFGNPTCRLNLVVEYADGSRSRFTTDESWRVSDMGPVRMANEYDGELYDARMELAGWTTAAYDDSAWLPAERSALPRGTLRAQMTPNMEAHTVGAPVATVSRGDTLILDFGRNMAGWISFIPLGDEGDTVRVRYAERLTPEGTLYTANLRDARSEDVYICRGGSPQPRYTPSLTYHGFRYAAVTGPASHFEAHTVGDPMEVMTDFVCSDSTLTRVVANALRGIAANYKGMPVDCPQRNERQPWLGDRTAGALGESCFFGNERLYAKWVRDICEAQREDGCIPDVAPAFWNYYTDNITWPAALPMVCDMLITQFGNDAPMTYAYPHMSRWMNHMLDSYARDGIMTRDRYGDWCVPPESPELIHSKDPARQTDGALISTAYTARCLELLGTFARRLGRMDDAARWDSLHTRTAEAFNRRFLTCRRGTSPMQGHPLYPDSVFYGTNTPTANILALAFGLVTDTLRRDVTDNLVTSILVGNNGHIPTGVIGTSWLLTTLSANGRGDVAWLLATNKTYPSWGYMAENGATTIWELWNGDTANPRMNSGNHVMLLGDLLTWVSRDLCGIRNGSAPGEFVFETDRNIPDCEYASGSRPTPWGPVSSRWERHPDGTLTWHVSLPAGTCGEVRLPDGRHEAVGPGNHTFTSRIPASAPIITEESHLYAHTSFPQCHAATIVETAGGDLVAAYFGGTHERHPDVCIWVSRKEAGSDSWSEPILAGDGVFMPGTPDALLAGVNDSTTLASAGPVKTPGPTDSLRRKACWNPVLFEMPSGELWLFYKVGLKVADWTGWLVKSTDGGRTWGPREPLPEGFIGPVKNKPELIGSRLVCPSSTESGGWKLHFEVLDTLTGRWDYIGPVDADSTWLTQDLLPDGTPRDGARMRPIQCIQPSLLRHPDGRLQVVMRTRNGRLATSWSADSARTWSRVELLDVPNNQSGTDAVTLADGTHLLIYNPLPTLPGLRKGPRTPLAVASSTDGVNWTHLVTLEDSPISQYSYPAIIEGRDGSIHCIYTWRRQRVGYKKLTLH